MTTRESVVYEVNEKGARVVQRNIEGIANSANKANSSLDSMKSLLAGFIGFQVFRDGLNTLRNFSQQMSTVRAITSATDDQFKNLRNTAKELGASTRFSATQAAEGMEFLARAGFNTDQVLTSISDTLNLAQAGALGLGDAADIASNILTGFRLEASQMANVVDILAFQSSRSNTNIQQLGEAMKFAAPVAAGLNVNIKDASAAIGALSDAGLQASLAGTGLRTAILQLTSPTTQGADTIRAMGLSLEQVDVRSRGLIPVLETLRDANLSVTEAVEIAGTRGGPALEVLVKSLDKIKASSTSLNDVDGFARKVAETMDDNLNGAVIAVGSAFEGLKIAIGDLGVESGLTQFFKSLASVLRFITANLSQFVDGLKIAIATLAVYQLTLIKASASGGIFVKSLKSIRVAVLAMNAALLANPIGALVLVVGGAIAILTTFSNKIKLSSDGVVTLANFSVELFKQISESLSGFIKFFSNVFSKIENILFSFFGEFEISWESAIKFAARSIDLQVGIVKAGFSIIKNIFSDLPNVIIDAFFSALNGSIKLIESFVNTAISILNKVGAKIKPIEFKGLNNPAKDTLKGIGEEAANILTESFNNGGVQQIVNNAFENARLNAPKNNESIKQVAQPTSTLDIENTVAANRTVLEEIENNVDYLQQLRTDLFNQIRQPIVQFAEVSKIIDEFKKASVISSQEATLFLAESNLVDERVLGIQLYKAEYQRALEEINILRQNDLINEEQAVRAKMLANNQYLQNRLQTTQQILGQLATFANSENKKAARIGKAAAIAQATIDGILAIQKALSSSPPPVNFVLAGVTAAATAANIASIRSQPTGFRTGGSFTVGGSGGPDSQLVPIMATPGEQVSISTPQQVKRGSQSNSESKTPNITIINVSDPNEIESYLSSSDSDTVFVNKIKSNATQIKQVVNNG